MRTGNPNGQQNLPGEQPERSKQTCPKCGRSFGLLPQHLLSCDGGADE